jgi:integrase
LFGWAATNTKAHASTRRAVEAHILPKLGEKLVVDLKTPELRQWHQGLAAAPPRQRSKKGSVGLRKIDRADPEAVRARRATANRVLTVLKAALTQAYDNERVPSDAAWRRVKPFKGADAARGRYLTADEGRRLMNAAAPAFRPLVRAALLTGARWGELTALKTCDFNADADAIHIRESKSGKPRYVPLNDEGTQFFAAHVVGRTAGELMFAKADGSAWGKSHQHRPMREACKAAKTEPPCSFHDRRNTYGALLAMAGTPVQVISALLGHSDTRITERHYAHLSPGHVAETLRNNLPAFNSKPKRKRKTRAKRGNVVAIRPAADRV